MSTPILGKNLKVNTSTSGVTFALAKSCDVTVNTAMQRVSNPNSGSWEHYIPTFNSWKISTRFLLSASKRTVIDTQIAHTLLTLTVEFGGYRYQGTGYINNSSFTGTVHELAQFTAEIQGTGPLSPV